MGRLDILVDQAPPVELAQRHREPDGNAQPLRQRQGAAQEAAVAPVPGRAVVPVVVEGVGPARAVEELEGVRAQERPLRENG